VCDHEHTLVFAEAVRSWRQRKTCQRKPRQHELSGWNLGVRGCVLRESLSCVSAEGSSSRGSRRLAIRAIRQAGAGVPEQSSRHVAIRRKRCDVGLTGRLSSVSRDRHRAPDCGTRGFSFVGQCRAVEQTDRKADDSLCRSGRLDKRDDRASNHIRPSLPGFDQPGQIRVDFR
jgi:hypothetical protein